MHIGSIGGIGVAGIFIYYQQLKSAAVAKGIKLEPTVVHADAQDLPRDNPVENRADQAIVYAKPIDRLKAARH